MDSIVGLEPDCKRIKGQDLDLMLCTEGSFIELLYWIPCMVLLPLDLYEFWGL